MLCDRSLPFHFQASDPIPSPWSHLTPAGSSFRILPRVPGVPSFRLHSFTDPHVAFHEGAKSVVSPLKCLTIAAHLIPCCTPAMAYQSPPVLCLCSHHSLPAMSTHACSPLLPLLFTSLKAQQRLSCRSLHAGNQMMAHSSMCPITTSFLGKCSKGFRFEVTWLHDASSAIFRCFLSPQPGTARTGFSLKRETEHWQTSRGG